MIVNLQRHMSHSLLLRLMQVPRRFLYHMLQRSAPRIRRWADSSYVVFLIRHPLNIRLKDYGLILLAFDLSHYLSRLMQAAMPVADRNYSILFGFLALLLIGPLDQLQIRHLRKVFSMPGMFLLLLGTLCVGFLCSFIAWDFFHAIALFVLLFLVTACFPIGGLSLLTVLFPWLPVWCVLSVLIIGNIITVWRRSQRGYMPSSMRPIALVLFLFAILLYFLSLASYQFYPLNPWGILLFAYPWAASAKKRLSRIALFVAIAVSILLFFALSSPNEAIAILLVAILLGMPHSKGGLSI